MSNGVHSELVFAAKSNTVSVQTPSLELNVVGLLLEARGSTAERPREGVVD